MICEITRVFKEKGQATTRNPVSSRNRVSWRL
jgi:hypothetical protein